MQNNFSGGHEMWNERFKDNKHLYTKEPNLFFRQYLSKKQKGKILLPGDGEGRNGVFAATLGWEVVSFDYSETGVEHSRELAKEQKVEIKSIHSTIENFSFQKDYFDIIAIIFLHLPRELRKEHFPRLLQFLKSGGEIYVLGFDKKQLENNSGGPKNVDMLYSNDELANSFQGLSIIQNSSFECEIDEGPKHQGKANLTEFIARLV